MIKSNCDKSIVQPLVDMRRICICYSIYTWLCYRVTNRVFLTLLCCTSGWKNVFASSWCFRLSHLYNAVPSFKRALLSPKSINVPLNRRASWCSRREPCAVPVSSRCSKKACTHEFLLTYNIGLYWKFVPMVTVSIMIIIIIIIIMTIKFLLSGGVTVETRLELSFFCLHLTVLSLLSCVSYQSLSLDWMRADRHQLAGSA